MPRSPAPSQGGSILDARMWVNSICSLSSGLGHLNVLS